MTKPIVILGIFVADTAYRAERQPKMGETILGKSFVLGPGGKGSNQAVAAARAGGDVIFAGCVGDDVFGGMMKDNLADAGVQTDFVREASGLESGAALIMVDQLGGNILSVAPGANRRQAAGTTPRSRAG